MNPTHARATKFIAGMLSTAAVLFLTGCPGNASGVPKVMIAPDVHIVDAGETVQFSATTAFDAAIALNWQWDFGDDTGSTDAAPAHVYTEPGVYTVSVQVSDPLGENTATEPNLIVVRSPEESPGEVGEVRTFAGIDFVWIPAGEFVMGSDDPGYATTYTQPLRTVQITRGFWMSKFEITQGQWRATMGVNPAYFPEPTGNRPIEQVSWQQAQDYIAQLNETQAGTFRLPTEAEWEYACRAGSTTEFYFGDDITQSPSFGWTWENARFLTRVSGLLQPNAWGLYDMSGNVWEWCSDYYDPDFYAEMREDDPFGPMWSAYRVARGGSWYNAAHEARSANRFGFVPNSTYNTIGFRICRN